MDWRKIKNKYKKIKKKLSDFLLKIFFFPRIGKFHGDCLSLNVVVNSSRIRFIALVKSTESIAGKKTFFFYLNKYLKNNGKGKKG